MANVTGHFQADFSAFSAAVQDAQIKLRGFEGDANKVGKSLDAMGDRFSGRAIIQEATLMTKAIEDIGGVSKLTATELAQVARVTGDATVKMKALGVEVPPEIQKMADATADATKQSKELGGTVPSDMGAVTGAVDKASLSLGGLGVQARQLDRIFDGLGISIGPQIRGLQDIAKMADQSFGSVGKLGTGIAVVDAAMTGWNIGRSVAEWAGLDKMIGNATSTLMGWGNVAGEEAAAKADTLARASKNAGQEITDMTLAVKINADAAKKAMEEATKANEAYKKWADAVKEMNEVGIGWERTLANMDGETVNNIKHSLEAGVSQGTLATAYEVTETQVKAVATQLQVEEAQLRDTVTANEDAAKAYDALAKETEARVNQQIDLNRKLQESTAKTAQEQLKLTNEAVVKEADAQKRLNGILVEQETAYTRLAAAQKTLRSEKVEGFSQQAQETELMDKFGQELMDAAVAEEKLRFAAQGANAETEKAPSVVDPAKDSVLSLGAAASQAADNFFSMSGELYNAIRAAQMMDDLAGKDANIYGATIGGIAGSTRASRFTAASNLQAWSSGGGLTSNITINGSVLGNKDEIARVVGDAVTSSYRSGGARLPV